MFCDVSRIDYSARRYTLRVVEKRLAKKKKIRKRERDVKFARAQEFLRKKKNGRRGRGIPPASNFSQKKKKKGQKFSKQSKTKRARAISAIIRRAIKK